MSYDGHIAQLLQANDIREYRVDKVGMASATPRNPSYGNFGTVRIPKVEDGLTYLVALHEIGHVMTHNNRNGKLLREAAAWEWAIENAHIPISQDDWHEGYTLSTTILEQRNHSKRLGFTPRECGRESFVSLRRSIGSGRQGKSSATRAGI